MPLDVRKLALHVKLIEILDRYRRVRRQMHLMQQWKKFLIHRN